MLKYPHSIYINIVGVLLMKLFVLYKVLYAIKGIVYGKIAKMFYSLFEVLRLYRIKICIKIYMVSLGITPEYSPILGVLFWEKIIKLFQYQNIGIFLHFFCMNIPQDSLFLANIYICYFLP